MQLVLLESNINKTDGGRDIQLYIDSETGIEYFVMNTSNCGAICPRLDLNGKPFIIQQYARGNKL